MYMCLQYKENLVSYFAVLSIIIPVIVYMHGDIPGNSVPIYDYLVSVALHSKYILYSNTNLHGQHL